MAAAASGQARFITGREQRNQRPQPENQNQNHTQ
jgi:hypothetical protein